MHDYCCQPQLQQPQQHASKEHLNGVGLSRRDFGVCLVVNDGPGGGRVPGMMCRYLSLVGKVPHVGRAANLQIFLPKID